MATIQIPVLFDMSGDTLVFGEEVSGDFVSSHLDFLLDMTTEANDISLNAADISSAILVGDQDTGDNIFYSGGSSGNVAVDNLCNRIANAITRGKLVHIPKTGNSSNSGIPMGGRLYVVKADGQQELPPDGQYAEKYPHSISPIGDEKMLGEAMASVAAVHLMGTPLAAGILVNKDSVQSDLETASGQTFNSGNTAFYNALAVQLSKVLGGSKSSAPMNSGASISASTNLASQIYYESFDNEDVTLETTHDTVYVTGRSGSGKALSTIGQTVAGLQWIQKTTDSTLSTDVIGVSFFMKFHTDVADTFIFDNRDNTDTKRNFYIGDAPDSGAGLQFQTPTNTDHLPDIYYNGTLQTLSANATTHSVGNINKLTLQDGNWHHFYLEYPSAAKPTSFTWFTRKDTGAYGVNASLDDLRYFDAALTTTQISDLAAGNNGNGSTGATEAIYPLDASGTGVPALKSIYEQLMNVPGRSQIMPTRDISGVLDNSNVTLTGGFPFITGDKLVMYLRPRIVFAAQTQAESNNSLYAFNYTGSTYMSVPTYNIADKNGDITGQTYSQSSSQNNTMFIFEKATTGDGVAGAGYWTSAGNTYNNSTGIHEGVNANGSTTNVDGANTIAGEWGQVDVGESSWATELQLTTNNSYTDRSPREFRLLASTDGTNWKTLIHQTEAGPWIGSTPQTFTISNPTSYRYYRYVVIKCYNAVNAGNIDARTSIGHFNLRGVKYPSEVVEVTNAGLMNGSPLDISGLQTNVVASSATIQDAFPGNATSGPEAETSKWGWMGSANSDSLSLDTTDVTDPRTIDLHIWKITITL